MNRYERCVLKNANASKEFISILSGVSRASRLSKDFPDQHKQTIWDTANNVIGPAFFCFMYWVLTTAQKQKIGRLYFLARDGQILTKVANIINEHYSLGVDCRYLYGSRQAWLIPSIHIFDDKQINWILSDWWYSLSVNSVCARLGIFPKEIGVFLKNSGFMEHQYSEKLNSKKKKTLKSCLQSKDFKEWFLCRSKIDFDNILGYFRQEGVLDGNKFGLVDIGWRGNQQLALNRILERNNQLSSQGIDGFYFGLTEGIQKSSNDRLHAFLFDLSASLNNLYIRNNHIYEIFAASPEGRTIRFEYKENKYYPILRNQANQTAIDWGIETQQQGIVSFAEMFIKHCPEEFLKEQNYNSVLESILYAFITRSSEQEATTYGQFPMDGEMTESNLQQIAPIVTRKQFWLSCLDLKNFRLFWIQATFIRSRLWFEFYLWKVVLPMLAVGHWLVSFVIKLLKG